MNKNTFFAFPITNGIAHRKEKKKTEKEKSTKVKTCWKSAMA